MMGNWLYTYLKHGFRGGCWSRKPRAVGDSELLWRYNVSNPTLDRIFVQIEGNTWLCASDEARVVPLFEMPSPVVSACFVVLRARVKGVGYEMPVCLEMSALGEDGRQFVSKDEGQPPEDPEQWSGRQLSLLVKSKTKLKYVRISLVFRSEASIWIKDLELYTTAIE